MMAVDEEASTRGTGNRLPSTVIGLGLTSFFTDIGSEMIFPLLPMFVASLGAAPAFLGLVEGLADATSSLLKLASGYLADRASAKKPMVVLGYSIAALVRPLIAVASAPWHVLAVRLTDRIGKGIRSTPRDVLIANAVSGDQAGRAFGFHRAFDHAGAVVGPLIATALLALGMEMRTVFGLALLPGLMSVAIVLCVREEPLPWRERPPAPSTSHSAQPIPRGLRGYLAILGCFCLANSSDAFLLLRASEVGVPVALIPLLWTMLHVSKLVSSYVGGGWSDRGPRTTLIVGGWMLYAVTYLAFGWANESWQIWILFAIYGVHYGLTEPAEKALVRDLVAAPLRGRAYGYFNFTVGITAVPAGLLTGWLWQTWGSRAALSFGAATAAASSLALLGWHRRLVRDTDP